MFGECRELPIEPEEAGLIDGLGRFWVFWRIVLPQMTSEIAAVAAIVMLSVVGSVPLIVAAGILALLPPAIVAKALNRHIRGALGGWSN